MKTPESKDSYDSNNTPVKKDSNFNPGEKFESCCRCQTSEHVSFRGFGGDIGWFVMCWRCGIRTWTYTDGEDPRGDALRDWNTRADTWISTKYGLPQEAIPVWGEMEKDLVDPVEYIMPLVLVGDAWICINSPVSRFDGNWMYSTFIRMEPPKRWKYML